MNFQVGDIIPDKSRHGWQVVASVSEKELSILWCPTLYDCLKKTKKLQVVRNELKQENFEVTK